MLHHGQQIASGHLGRQIMGAKIRARGAREAAEKAAREADRAEAYAWSVQMEGYGGLSRRQRSDKPIPDVGCAANNQSPFHAISFQSVPSTSSFSSNWEWASDHSHLSRFGYAVFSTGDKSVRPTRAAAKSG